jgi:hypothetical protein
MLGISRLAVVRSTGDRPKHLKHVGIDSWLDYMNTIYNQKHHGLSSTVHLPFPSQDTNEEI